MDLDQAYLEAAMPEPVVLLHQELHAYSLGHEMLLQRHGSPFVAVASGVATLPELEDLYTAVFICCHTYEEANYALNRMAVNSTEFDEQLMAWQKLVVEENKGPLGDEQLIELILDFQRYVRDGSRCPKFNSITEGGPRKKPGAPLLALMLRCLTAVYHFTKSEALNTPYGWAQWLYLTESEQGRRCRIVTEDDRTEWARIQEEMKKRGWEPIGLEAHETPTEGHHERHERPEGESNLTSQISNLKETEDER